MKKRDFLTLTDVSREEILDLLDTASAYKAQRSGSGLRHVLNGRTLAMIFNKPSMRTRVSFEVGIYELGGRVVYLTDMEVGLSTREPISHAARVMSRYVDGLVIRTFSHQDLEELAGCADVPVVNALTDSYHPCQVLSDLLTVRENLGEPDGLKVAWVGDGNNMAHSWINAAAVMGFDLSLGVPPGYEPDPAVLERARGLGSVSIEVTNDPEAAVAGANVVNTDVWASMGQEAEAEDRARVFRPYQLNAALMSKAASGAIVLHCLPAHLGEEITEEVLESPQSVVFDQAENRLHAQKALLAFLLSEKDA